MTVDPVTIRPRSADDIPGLTDLLFAQQSVSRYPVRDPLPIPAPEFLHADDAAGAWVAEYEDRLAGHICHTGPAHGFDEADAMNTACASAHGCGVAELGWVSTLFVDPTVRGHGLGRRLLRAAVDDLRARRLRPCLEVVDLHAAAAGLYRAGGWVEVLRVRSAWLAEVEPDPEVGIAVMVLPGDTADEPAR